MIAFGVHILDRQRGTVRLEDERSLRVIACGDHRGRPCSGIVASHAVALDENGVAYAVDVARMTARPLGTVVSSILRSEVAAK